MTKPWVTAQSDEEPPDFEPINVEGEGYGTFGEKPYRPGFPHPSSGDDSDS